MTRLFMSPSSVEYQLRKVFRNLSCPFSVVVALTDAGVARLTETAPAHMRGVSDLFVAQLGYQGPVDLERALGQDHLRLAGPPSESR